jgi:hypothetical protein
LGSKYIRVVKVEEEDVAEDLIRINYNNTRVIDLNNNSEIMPISKNVKKDIKRIVESVLNVSRQSE